MKIKTILTVGIIVPVFAIGLTAQVSNKPASIPGPNGTFHIEKKLDPQRILKIKSEGEVIAELHLLKSSKLVMDGLKVTQEGVGPTAKGGSISISPDGLPTWQMSGEGLEVEISEIGAARK